MVSSDRSGNGDPWKVQGLIVGAGPSGLSTAYALQGDTVILEKESEVGGLCRSIERGGGVFDIGGHSFHTPHPEVNELVDELMEGGIYRQKREARVFSHGTILPYPFQKNFDRIPDPDVVRECEEGLQAVEGEDPGAAENFEEYIVKKFGPGIAEHFMLPYNRKLWARDIRKISCEWTSERVADPKGKEQTFDEKGGKRKPLQSDTRVGYPREGGYQEFYRSFVPHVPEVRTDSPVVRIDPDRRVARTADGTEFEWTFLVSTMPLPELVRVVEGVPEEVVAAADALEYMSLRVELLLAGRSLDTEIHRIYCADPDIPPHKIALNHNSSESLRQRPVHAIMAEVSVSDQKEVDVDRIAPDTVAFLSDLGILEGPEDITWQGHVDVKYAYPVYTHERPEQLARIKAWLGERDIYTLGRFGEWKYINSDKCVHQGLELGRRLRERYMGRTAAGAGGR
jgi:UDP-galactopyranose mutase